MTRRCSFPFALAALARARPSLAQEKPKPDARKESASQSARRSRA
jgi:hypothetical protein